MNYRRVINKLALSIFALAVAPVALAQDDAAGDDTEELILEEVIVTGSIRASLANSIIAKRNSDNLIETIFADDIGKLPDQNLAEVLENIPGVQITRTAGVGTGVQIRGTNANRTEINGVSTVGSGS
ncbi:MAG: TonB-dependent receptor plug domain-containing protein, partial [Xanthomonadales bacterium]|nr:TonB-dependent receptor plug domain-containing protein [Xanthomonadales bacterium]